jgi:hypothetical protein
VVRSEVVMARGTVMLGMLFGGIVEVVSIVSDSCRRHAEAILYFSGC